ncbi:DNA protecting protein DprA [Alkaliphilus metalliredigens QYMF]|uniref:DNA protecting protein DprA n=1 Tax=Alkaliphilus metalliredigens (strain QYMF) TaxID=293826 RepID=A6TRR9_ALKMQ|nr:DNA-processing protein DprA [Alkaliphilus metalliredigens]ABR48887.1 DNA protecting protein DprA [Alkaliphilus metalliredigens QYMF]
MNLSKKDILIWLSHIGGVDHQVLSFMKNYFGSIEEIWTAESKHIFHCLHNHSIIASRMMKNRNIEFYEKAIREIERSHIHVITELDTNYPEKLRHIYRPPFVLYQRGKLNMAKPGIAIVGARKATPYGKWVAQKFAQELAAYHIGVISGLALGVDTASHQGALQKEGYTIAVLGCGLEQCYPASNQMLFNKIIESDGCILSEYAPGTPPLKHHFPMRNRIISALSDGVVIIEAGKRSGAMITVECGIDQGKEIYAVPGNINSGQSYGPNNLIQQGAKPLLEISNIIEDLEKIYRLESPQTAEQLERDLSEKEILVYKVIEENPVSIDAVINRTGIHISELSALLTILEIKGFITQLSGNTFTVSK